MTTECTATFKREFASLFNLIEFNKYLNLISWRSFMGIVYEIIGIFYRLDVRDANGNFVQVGSRY
jgi:hypothetical protein